MREMVLLLIELVKIYLVGFPIALIIAHWKYREYVKIDSSERKLGYQYCKYEIHPDLFQLWIDFWEYEGNPKLFYRYAVFWPITLVILFISYTFFVLAFGCSKDTQRS